MKRIRLFEANDGRTFATAAECREHDDRSLVTLLEGLSNDAVADAIERRNIELADAFERAGAIISAKRRGSGELRRAKSKAGRRAEIGALLKAEAFADKTGEKAGKLLADKLSKRSRSLEDFT
jgi:hypothetical protein